MQPSHPLQPTAPGVLVKQTRLLMEELSKILNASGLPPNGHARREQLRSVSSEIEATLLEFNYHANFVRLGAKVSPARRPPWAAHPFRSPPPVSSPSLTGRALANPSCSAV